MNFVKIVPSQASLAKPRFGSTTWPFSAELIQGVRLALSDSLGSVLANELLSSSPFLFM